MRGQLKGKGRAEARPQPERLPHKGAEMAKKKNIIYVLKSLEECERVMTEIWAATAARKLHAGNMDAEIAVAREKHGPAIAELDGAIDRLTEELQQYYMSHLAELEGEGKKSIELRHGVMGRRLSPPALKLLTKAWKWATVAVRLEDVFGDRFLRQADPEADKEAIKAADLAPEDLRLCGLKIEQDEVFFAEPTGKEGK